MALIPKSQATGAVLGLAAKGIASLFQSKNTVGQSSALDPNASSTATGRKNVDFRARLKLKPSDYDRISAASAEQTSSTPELNKSSQQEILGNDDPTNILSPLYNTLGILFPYTPVVTYGTSANYAEMAFSHTNYKQWSYVSSSPNTITITALFTAQTTSEAQYLHAVWHFFNVVTKSYFGINPVEKRGTPPPVLLFDYLGDQMFNNVPVVIKDVNTSFDNTVNYVPVINSTGDVVAYVPTEMTFTISMEIQQNPNRTVNEFDLDKFRTGALLGKGYV